MSYQDAEIDAWTSEQIAQFKERARQRVPHKISTFGLSEDGTPNLGKIVAEGDSWFDYTPGTDVIDWLKEEHNCDIDSYARAGDTLENMIYGTEINNDFQREHPSINSVLARIGQTKPKVFLFSGGGNDIAGDEFESYLNHAESGLPALREQFADDMINNVFRRYFENLIARVAAVCPQTHIVTHGYGRTIPTGKGVKLLFFTFAGPWLRPALAKKGIFDYTEQRKAVFAMIDKYNSMLRTLAQQNAKFHHVDLRGILDPDTDWENELHLKNSAYRRVAAKIYESMKAI